MAVKVGIVGCGRIATAVHLLLLRRNSAVKVTAAVDIDENRLHETMERFRIEEGYADHRSMLERADIDAVCCHIMDFNPYAIETLWRAYKAGVGEIDIGRIQVLGERIDDVKKVFSHPTRSPKNVLTALRTRLKIYLRKQG